MAAARYMRISDHKYSDIYDMAKDTFEFAKLNLVAMLHAEK